MNKIIVDKKEYPVDYAYAPAYDGTLTLKMWDDRRLPVIGSEFEDKNEIIFVEESVGTHDYSGYSKLVLIQRQPDNAVLIKLAKEG